MSRDSPPHAATADAAARRSAPAVRGPLFGVAAHRGDVGRRWRMVVEVPHGCPRHACDALNSQLWFRAKNEAKSRQERRALRRRRGVHRAAAPSPDPAAGDAWGHVPGCRYARGKPG
ncbi:DUF5954 family protein [Streptomyces sp. NPDC087219]|uniref:DUF5954 family protein n=1 Tax=Streptomyces sp. NPDC087219 TaxID=3365770 RepID=UPI00382BB625